MTPFIFPTTVAIFMFGSWVIVFAFAPCILEQRDPKFDCWSSLQFVGTFACIGSVLTGLVALLARVVLHPLLSFTTRRPELLSALLSSTTLTLLFLTAQSWQFDVGHIGIQLFGWLGISFLICSSSLLTVKYQTSERRAS